ncbi:hypothetical protein GCM10010207_66970 [Streptomyces atratus]|nr:hypothetical protein GCM10010207_66970 [Streptomyces atratus]
MADAIARREDVGGAPGDPHVARVDGVRNGVMHESVRGGRVCLYIGGIAAEIGDRIPHQRMLVVDDLISGEIGGKSRDLLDQLHGRRA